VPESLKNILLVMASGDYLVRPPPPSSEEDDRSQQQKDLWAATCDGLDRFLPGLVPEVFPEVADGHVAQQEQVRRSDEGRDGKEGRETRQKGGQGETPHDTPRPNTASPVSEAQAA